MLRLVRNGVNVESSPRILLFSQHRRANNCSHPQPARYALYITLPIQLDRRVGPRSFAVHFPLIPPLMLTTHPSSSTLVVLIPCSGLERVEFDTRHRVQCLLDSPVLSFPEVPTFHTYHPIQVVTPRRDTRVGAKLGPHFQSNPDAWVLCVIGNTFLIA